MLAALLAAVDFLMSPGTLIALELIARYIRRRKDRVRLSNQYYYLVQSMNLLLTEEQRQISCKDLNLDFKPS